MRWLRVILTVCMFMAVFLFTSSLFPEVKFMLQQNRFSPFLVLHNILAVGLPLTMPILTLIPKQHSNWRNFFSWKIWLIPSIIVIMFSLSQWRFVKTLDWRTNMLGYEWSWCAISTWTCLFIAQLIFYQKRNIEKVDSFVLASSGVLIASILYEVPYFLAQDNITMKFLSTKFIYSLICIVTLLFIYKWKPTKVFVVCSSLFLLGWLTYWQLPYWACRLTVFPLLLTLPFGLKKRGDLRFSYFKPCLQQYRRDSHKQTEHA